MTLREWELNEDLEEVIGKVENLTLAVKERLGETDQHTLLDLLDQVRRLRVRLDRLAYAVEAMVPLAELENQIAEHDRSAETADRLRAERERVARAKAAKE